MSLTYCKTKEFSISQGQREIKVFQFGTKTATEVSSFGDDAVPLKNMTAIYGNTSEIGENVIIGYINTNQIATEGEKRVYSVNPNTGDLSFSIHLRTDGTCEVGGNTDNAVRYSPLNTAINGLDSAINIELGKISAAIASLGGSYVVTPITTDISSSKINEIKTL